MQADFPYAGLRQALIRATADGWSCELWTPPAGIWRRSGEAFLGPHLNDAMAHAAELMKAFEAAALLIDPVPFFADFHAWPGRRK